MGKKAWEAARITVSSWVLQELLLCSGDVVPALQKPASPRMSSGRTLIALNDPICLLTVERGLPVGAFSHLFVPRGGGGCGTGNRDGIISVCMGILGCHHSPQPDVWLKSPRQVERRLL